jgi:hypothetical protein
VLQTGLGQLVAQGETGLSATDDRYVDAFHLAQGSEDDAQPLNFRAADPPQGV